MKITLDERDLERMNLDSDVEIEFDESIVCTETVKTMVAEAIQDHISFAGPLYQEVRKQVDDYIKNHLPTLVGNYIRTENHTAHRIMTDEIKKEVEKGIECAVRVMARDKATNLFKVCKNLEELSEGSKLW